MKKKKKVLKSDLIQRATKATPPTLNHYATESIVPFKDKRKSSNAKSSKEAKVISFPAPVSSDGNGEPIVLFPRILQAWHFGIDSEAISSFAVELLQKIQTHKNTRHNAGFPRQYGGKQLKKHQCSFKDLFLENLRQARH